MAGGASASPASYALQPRAAAQRRWLEGLTCQTADLAPAETERSMPIILSGVHCVSGGSIEVIR
jgi:hypothetical protein